MTVTESIRFPTELYQVYRQEFFARKELMLFLSEHNCRRITTVDRGELKRREDILTERFGGAIMFFTK